MVQAYNLSGDVVGCFIVETVGLYGFMRIYGEDTTANPPIPGMQDDELVVFRVNGASAASTPLHYWQDDRSTHQVDLNAGGIEQQSAMIDPGWNLISFNVDPPYPLVSLVLQSINNRYDRVFGETGSYSTEIDDIYNSLKELHCGEGYYLRSTSATGSILLVDGLDCPADTPISLHQGWNWIGYLPDVTIPITQALQSIDGQYQLVHSMNETYDPSNPDFSTLTEMSPGKGYLLYANQAISLTYPSGSGLFHGTEMNTVSTGCEQITPTPYFTVVYGWVNLNGELAPVGTRVEVFTPRGELAGCYVLEEPGKLLMTHIYGADGEGISGFLPGEALTFKVNGVSTEGDTSILWTDDKTPYQVDMNTSISIYLPVLTTSGTRP